MTEEAQGGRIFFSSTGRSLVDEDEIVVLSVGVDIGSSTSHLVFSRIVLERLDSRYVVSIRETFYQSDILLTPYAADEEIDAQALRAFIEREYKAANVDPGRDRHRRADPDRGRGAPTQRPQDRRTVRPPGRQDGRGLGRRQPGDRHGRARLGRGGALDPRQGDGHERRRRRRHLEDRDLLRRPGDRPHRPRRRRAPGLPRRRRAHRAHRGGGPPLRRRARSRSRGRGCCSRPRPRARSPRGWRIDCSRPWRAARRRRGGSGLLRLDPLSHVRNDRRGHLLRRRRGIHLRPRSAKLRRSRRAARAGNSCPRRQVGTASSSARTKASAPP